MRFTWKRIIAFVVFSCVLAGAFAQNISGFRTNKSLYSFGEWFIYWADDGDVTIYRDDGDLALEFVGGSNGWWHLRYYGDEYVVWSTGDTETQEFFDHPWEYVDERPLAVKDGDFFTTGSEDAITKYAIDGDYLRIDLSDEGSVDIYKKGSEIDFYNYEGDYFVYPDDIAPSDDTNYNYDEFGYDDSEDIDIGLIGRRVEIIDSGEIYTSINTTDCLTWPDDETMEMAGEDYWDDYWPTEGDVGTVIWTSKHCDSDDIIALVVIDGYYVCIGVDGISTTSYSRGESPDIVYY